MPQLSTYAWLCSLCCAAILLAACKRECPPLSVPDGQYCRWTRGDAGVAGNAGHAAMAGAGDTVSKAGQSGTASGAGGGRGSWTCTQDGEGCSCVAGGNGSDSCTAPKPDCCSVFTDTDAEHCRCVPEADPACAELGMKTDARSVSTCPP